MVTLFAWRGRGRGPEAEGRAQCTSVMGAKGTRRHTLRIHVAGAAQSCCRLGAAVTEAAGVCVGKLWCAMGGGLEAWVVSKRKRWMVGRECGAGACVALQWQNDHCKSQACRGLCGCLSRGACVAVCHSTYS